MSTDEWVLVKMEFSKRISKTAFASQTFFWWRTMLQKGVSSGVETKEITNFDLTSARTEFLTYFAPRRRKNTPKSRFFLIKLWHEYKLITISRFVLIPQGIGFCHSLWTKIRVLSTFQIYIIHGFNCFIR